MVRVKICGITNYADARAAAACGTHLLGFNFYPTSRRFVSPDAAREIVLQVKREFPQLQCVGVFVNEQVDRVREIVSHVRLDAAQLHGDESPAECRELEPLKIIKAIRVTDDFNPQSASQFGVADVLLDAFCHSTFGGTGKLCDWEKAREARTHVSSLWLAGGLNAANVADAIRYVQPCVVDVCGGVESAPGEKDETLMRDFVRETELASAGLVNDLRSVKRDPVESLAKMV